jgi:hypothetical protein
MVKSQDTTHHLGQIHHHPIILKHPFRHDKPLGQFPPFPLSLLFDILQHPLEVLHVVVRIPLDGRTRDLEAFVNGEIDTAISDNDVAALGKRRDGGRDGGERLRVDDGGLGAEERGDLFFECGVDVWWC